jgi:chaperonin GroEL
MVGQRRPGVIFQPQTHQAIQRGVRQIVDVVRPTLGPVPRYVGIERDGKTPELLDDAGLIARRVIELAGPAENMGAMHIRSVLWQVREEVGDGAATTAILFWAILEGALRYLAAGGNAPLLRRNLEAGLRDIITALDAQVTPVRDRAQIEALALSLCRDRSLAELLAETFEMVGHDGRIEVRKGHGRETFLEFVPGTYWDSGLVPQQNLSGSTLRRVDLHNALVLITDLEIEDPQQLAPLVRLIEFEGSGPFAIVAMKFSDKALGLLHFINRRMGKIHAVAIKPPEAVEANARRIALDDLALLTGGRVFIAAAGDTLRGLRSEDLGAARQVWADNAFVGVISGKGDPRAVRARIEDLKLQCLRQETATNRHKTLLRIGQLQGGTVTVMVGGMTERDLEQQKDRVERAVNALRHAPREGMLPGGGIALLNCQPALRDRLSGAHSDERAACMILLNAVEAPLRVLVHNAGHDWSAIVARIQQAGTGYGCDTLSGGIVDMRAASICDIAHVTKEAVRRAVSGAALLLTTDTLVRKRNPQTVFDPK